MDNDVSVAGGERERLVRRAQSEAVVVSELVKLTGRVLGMIEFGEGLVVATEDGVFSITSYINLDTGEHGLSVSTIMFREAIPQKATPT